MFELQTLIWIFGVYSCWKIFGNQLEYISTIEKEKVQEYYKNKNL